MAYAASQIAAKADRLAASCGTRDPFEIAKRLGVVVRYCKFGRQRGAYKVISRVGVVFLNESLREEEARVVLAHELGHDCLHKAQAAKRGGFEEFGLFQMTNDRREQEANLFAAQLLLDDGEFLDCCRRGYDVRQIAAAMGADVNLVALKGDLMIARGYRFAPQEHRNDFLRYDR